MSNREWLRISEYVLLSLSILGAIAFTVTQQVIYLAVPLILSLALNLANRPRLNPVQSQQQISQLQATLQNFQETMDTSNQRLQQIEAWRQQLSQVIDQKIEMSMQNISTAFDEFNQKIATIDQRLNQLDDSIVNLRSSIGEQEEKIIHLQHTQTELAQLQPQLQAFNLRFEEIEQAIKNSNDINQQQLAAFTEIKEHQNQEFALLHQQIEVFQPRLQEIDKKIADLEQNFQGQFHELEKIQQNHAAEILQFNQGFITINQRLTNLDKLTELDVFLDALLEPLPIPNSEETTGLIQALPVTSISESDDNIKDLVFVGTLTGHDNKVLSVAFSPDAQSLASGSEDKTIKIWDLATQKHHTFAALQDDVWSGGINSVIFHPHGKILASASDDTTIRLWNVDTGENFLTFRGHEHQVSCIAFSSNGKILASGSKDKTVKLWSVKTGQEVYSFKGHVDEVLCIAFSPDNQILASGGGIGDRNINILQLAEKTVRTLRVSSDWFVGGINSLAFSPNGEILASGSQDKTIKLWDVVTGEEINILQGHTDHVCAVVFSPNGNILASASKDNTVKLWSVDSGEEFYSVKCADDAVYSLAFSPDGRILAAGSGDKTITLFPCPSR
jgi:WD40 repeat protein/predicted  nucleic acid-binding Zn-ribbon protein